MSTIMKIVKCLTYPRIRNHFTLLGSISSLQKYRYFHNSQRLHLMYKEHENKYAYNILINKGYAINLNPEIEISSLSNERFEEIIRDNWSFKTPQELFSVFAQLGEYCCHNKLSISDTMFDNYIDCLTDNIRLASDQELESLFYALNKWPNPSSIRVRNYIEVWTALDDECLKRVRNWSYDQLLSFTALFYLLNVTRVSDFSIKSLQKLSSKAKQLTPCQTVQTLFFIGVLRKQPFDMHNLELHLINNFSKFTIDDLAIMSMGFFKSKTPIRNMALVSQMMNLVKQNAKNIHEVSLAALLKIIRYSVKITVDDSIYQLLDKLQHEVSRLSIMCNVHLALLGTSTLTLHKHCLTNIAENVIKNISKTRIKDLERMVLTFSTFNLIPKTEECFFSKVVDELRKPEREEEIMLYGRSFTCCLSYLGISGIYPIDLIRKALDPKFLKTTYGDQVYHYGKEILAINNTAELFCNSSELTLLSEKTIKVLAKKYTDYVPTLNYAKQYNITERMMLDVMKVLKDCYGGDDYVIGDHILCHHQRGGQLTKI